jgi:hypothetical protein
MDDQERFISKLYHDSRPTCEYEKCKNIHIRCSFWLTSVNPEFLGSRIFLCIDHHQEAQLLWPELIYKYDRLPTIERETCKIIIDVNALGFLNY